MLDLFIYQFVIIYYTFFCSQLSTNPQMTTPQKCADSKCESKRVNLCHCVSRPGRDSKMSFLHKSSNLWKHECSFN